MTAASVAWLPPVNLLHDMQVTCTLQHPLSLYTYKEHAHDTYLSLFTLT